MSVIDNNIVVERKGKKSDRGFTFPDLPPRVIVHEILSHIELLWKGINIVEEWDSMGFSSSKGDEEPKDPFTHFGYFQRDRRRSIWFVFTSVTVWGTTDIILCFPRLFSLKVACPTNEFFLHLIDQSSNMNLLESLRISLSGDCEHISRILSKDNAFKNLQKFVISNALGRFCDIFSRDWIVHENNVLSRLKSFGVYDGSGCVVTKNNEENVFKKLGSSVMELKLSYIRFSEIVELHVPNLKKFQTVSCENERIVPGMDVVSIYSSPNKSLNSWQNVEEIYKKSKFLENITLILFDQNLPVPNQWLFSENCVWNKLQYLKKVSLQFRDRVCPVQENANFGPNLEHLSIEFTTFSQHHHLLEFPESVFFREYKKLHRVELRGKLGVSLHPSKPWNALLHVRELSLYWTELFQRLWDINHTVAFSELTSLRLINESFSVCDHVDLKLPKLRDLFLRLSGDDSIFRNLQIPKLRKISLGSCENMSGRGWRRRILNDWRSSH